MEKQKIILNDPKLSTEELIIDYHEKAKIAFEQNNMDAYNYYLECANDLIKSNEGNGKKK